jgi:hypothetical protein
VRGAHGSRREAQSREVVDGRALPWAGWPRGDRVAVLLATVLVHIERGAGADLPRARLPWSRLCRTCLSQIALETATLEAAVQEAAALVAAGLRARAGRSCFRIPGAWAAALH